MSPPPGNTPEPLDRDLRRRLAPLSRRRFLVGAVAVSAAAVAGARACAPADVTLPEGVRHLTAAEHAVMLRALTVFLPLEGSRLTPLDRVPVMRNLDDAFGALPRDVRRDLGAGLRLFDLGAVALGLHLKRFSRLGDEEARAYCERWMRGSRVQRAVFSAIKQFVYVSYWREPATWGPVEYDGPVTRKHGIPRLGITPFPGAGAAPPVAAP